MTEGPDFNDWLDDKSTKPAQPRPPVDLPIGYTGGDSYARKALTEECAEVAGAPEGRRNHQLNTSTFNMASIVAAGRIGRDEVANALTNAARAAGLDDSEIGPTIQSGFRGSDTKVGARAIPDMPDQSGGTTFVAEQAASMQNVGPEPKNCAPTDDDTTPPTATLEDIENGFWQKRDYLTLIYNAAISRMASPWAVLACCMARALALVPPHIVLPPIIGGEGSLNWFAAISAKSGGGKGAAMAVAETLMPYDVNVRGIGSGEGMVEVYQRAAPDKKDPPPPVTSVLFSIEEIDSLGAMGGRSGQTTMAILRQGFSGEKLGYSYRGRQGESVDKHSYRMTVVASVQPERAGVLFEDAGGGTPQRFMWFPGRDKRITADPPPVPDGRLTLPRALEDAPDEIEILGPNGHAPFKRIRTPPALDRTIREARALSMNGDDDTLNSHALFCREKFAYGLAVLAGGMSQIGGDDWELSATAAAVSDWCRTKAQEGYARGLQRHSREKGEMRAHEHDEQNIVSATMQAKRTHRIVALIVKHIHESGPASEADLHRRQSGRDRTFFPSALLAAFQGGAIVKQGDLWALP